MSMSRKPDTVGEPSKVLPTVSLFELFFGLLLRRHRSLESVTFRPRLDDMSGFWCKNSLTIQDIEEKESSIPL